MGRLRTPLILFAAVLLFVSTAAASEITILQTEPPRSMDPANQTATYTAAVLYPMYEGLVRSNDKNQIVPDLATSWKPNATGTEWTFHIRPGVTFHDGTKLDAQGVKANFDRLINKKAGLAGAGRFQEVIKSVTVVDPLTVKFTLYRPYAPFLGLLAESQASLVSPAAIGKGTLDKQADGTGPYQFVQWKTGDYVLMKRYPGYWGTEPSVDQLKWTWSSEQAVMTMSIQSNSSQVVNPLPPVFAKSLEHDSSVKVLTTPGSAVFWLALNVKLKPLNDVRVRQALNYATDKKALVSSMLHGYGKVANSPLAPADFGYDPNLTGYPYNPAKAKQLLKEAGYPNGFTMSIDVQSSQTNLAEALQGMWQKVGVKLKVNQMESGVWTTAAFADPAKKAKQKTYSVLASWSTSTLDADGQLTPLYATQSWAPKSANLGFYSNKKLDKILQQAASTTDRAQRKQLYDQAQKIINHDAPMVILYYATAVAAKRANVGNIGLNPGSELLIRDPILK